jgi:hypothetical protein
MEALANSSTTMKNELSKEEIEQQCNEGNVS